MITHYNMFKIGLCIVGLSAECSALLAKAMECTVFLREPPAHKNELFERGMFMYWQCIQSVPEAQRRLPPSAGRMFTPVRRNYNAAKPEANNTCN
jgi:hypothetical protein